MRQLPRRATRCGANPQMAAAHLHLGLLLARTEQTGQALDALPRSSAPGPWGNRYPLTC
jgi:hypothetical protein